MHVAAKGNTAYPGLWEKGMVILIEGGDGAFCLRPWSDKRKAETLMIREADTQLAHTPARDTWDDKLAKARLKRDKGGLFQLLLGYPIPETRRRSASFLDLTHLAEPLVSENAAT
ncbi:hypothetical protein SCARD494_07976 [Seiridium cardinale]